MGREEERQKGEMYRGAIYKKAKEGEHHKADSKMVHVVPVFKKEEGKDPGNYKPKMII